MKMGASAAAAPTLVAPSSSPVRITQEQRERMEANRKEAKRRLELKRKRGEEEEEAGPPPTPRPTPLPAAVPRDGGQPGPPPTPPPPAEDGGHSAHEKIVCAQKRPGTRLPFYVVLDLECTCDEGRELQPQEIIEFSCCLLDTQTGQIVSTFQAYCRPTENPRLTSFATSLTGITQGQVDQGKPLGEALRLWGEWLREVGLSGRPESFAVVTWGDWDLRVMVEMETKWRKMAKPRELDRWVDLKKVYVRSYGKPRGLRKSVEHAGLEWVGRAHSGIDDAVNTARLAAHLLAEKGAALPLTGWFRAGHRDKPPPREFKVGATGQPGGLGGGGGRPLAQGTLMQMAGWRGRGAGGTGVDVGGDTWCKCGVKAKRRTVKKPGPSHGREFLSCGKWSITEGGRCDHFAWLPPK